MATPALKRPEGVYSSVTPRLCVDCEHAREIAVAHGGSIEYSFADPYVVFSVRLPVRHDPAADPSAQR